MEQLPVESWEWNQKRNQLEVVLKDHKHLGRKEVGKQVELKAGGRTFDLGLFAIGLFLHDDGAPAEGAAKLIPLPGSDLKLEEVAQVLSATKDIVLEVASKPAEEPSRHFQDPLTQIKSKKLP